MAKARRKQADVGINMTPMIDIVFQLILFFMLASQLASAEVDQSIKVPDLAESRAEVQDPKPPIRLVINMAADVQPDDPTGRRSRDLKYIKAGPRNLGIDMDLVRDILQLSKERADEQKGELVLILRAHRTLAWSYIRDVMNVASDLKIKNVHLSAPIGEWGATHTGGQR